VNIVQQIGLGVAHLFGNAFYLWRFDVQRGLECTKFDSQRSQEFITSIVGCDGTRLFSTGFAESLGTTQIYLFTSDGNLIAHSTVPVVNVGHLGTSPSMRTEVLVVGEDSKLGPSLVLADLASGTSRVLRTGSGLGSVEWCPDPRQYIYDQNGTIFIADIRTEGTQRVAEGQGASWRPGRSQISYCREHGIFLRGVPNGPEQQIARVKCSGPPRWSPDGRFLLVSHRLSGGGGHVETTWSVFDGSTGKLTDVYSPTSSISTLELSWAKLDQQWAYPVEVGLPPRLRQRM